MVAVIAALGASTPSAVVAQAARADEREMHGREAFAAGHYRQALDIYVKLYAERLHPNYLRNIGRCYQNLEDPDSAISSFREYLRKATRVSPEERAEIEGYVAEMRALKLQRRAAVGGPPGETRIATPPPPALPERPILHAQAPPPASPPVYRRWWFWTLLGAALAGGAVAFAVARGKTDLCPPGRDCGP